MADKRPLLAAETGTWRTTSPNPHVDLSGTAVTATGIPFTTFKNAADDSTVDFDSGHKITVTFIKDGSNAYVYEDVVWTDAATDTLDLSSATQKRAIGSIANGDTVSCYASEPSPVPSEYDYGNLGATATVNHANGEAQKGTLNANCTITLSNGATGKGNCFRFVWTVSGGAYAVTLTGTNYAWVTGSAPTFGTADNNRNFIAACWMAGKWALDGGTC